MRDSEFKKAYLNIIKEGLGDMAMGEEAPVAAPTEEAPATDSTAKRVCFTTTNEELINALTTGFEEKFKVSPDEFSHQLRHASRLPENIGQPFLFSHCP